MAGQKTKFETFLAEELEKERGVYFPVRALLAERLFVKQMKCTSLHPNPDDEFCKPEVGPSYEIVSRYEQTIQMARMRGDKKPIKEPLIVEKVRPDGYMLLNGHHRWAAAIRMGEKKLPVQVINIATENDIRKMLEKSTHNRRVTLDLDEVVFVSGPDEAAEKALLWPFNRVFRERLRLGVPALFHFLRAHKYDIWVYSAKYYSLEHIYWLFRLYGVRIDGVETGTGKRHRLNASLRKWLDQMIARKYPRTVHVDNHAAVCIDSQTKAFEEYPLSGDPRSWSQEIMDIIGKLDKPAK